MASGIQGTVASEPTARTEGTILVVDDEEDILLTLTALFQSALRGVRILTASHAHEGLEILHREPVDVVIADYRLPETDGLAFLRRAREVAPDAPRIMITAHPRLDVATRAVEEAGIHRFIIKPVEPTELIKTVRSALERRDAPLLQKGEVDQIFSKGSRHEPDP